MDELGSDTSADVLNRSTNTAVGQGRVLFVDPGQMVRSALSHDIEIMSAYRVIGFATNAEEALQQVRNLKPDILITELQLPGKSGLELLNDLKKEKGERKNIVLSAFASTQSIQRAFSLGAHAYISKNASIDELILGLNHVTAKKRYLSPILECLSHGAEFQYSQTPCDPLSPLSPREREIFFHLANGMQNAAIARKLYISPRTVETHRARIVRKLGVKTNSDLIRYAIKNEIAFL